MARARNIKPGFFKNEYLAELPTEDRLLFIGLWTLADREGRLEDRPRRIKAELFPFDSFDVDSMLNRLQDKQFIIRYEANGYELLSILNFVKHQDPHYKEKASVYPPPDGHSNQVLATNVTRTQRARIFERDGAKCKTCGEESHLCIDHIIPVSGGGKSDDSNLQVLCISCNTRKSNKIGDNPATKNQVRFKHGLIGGEYDPLFSDSPSSDSPSLIPDSLCSLSGKPDDAPQEVSAKMENGNGQAKPDTKLIQQADEVIAYMNRTLRASYRAKNPNGQPTASGKTVMNRLKEGYTVEQLKAVFMAKGDEWFGDDKMAKFLRPETLYCAKHFSDYLGQVGSQLEAPNA